MPNSHNNLSRRAILQMVPAAIAVTTFNAPTAFAQDAAARGLEIAARNDASDRGFRDSTAALKMVLKNRAGQQATREMRLLTLERPNQKVGDLTIAVFQSPADVAGTALLSHAKLQANDDQWLFLPANKRVKRISSSNKSGPFVGSEFAYEDITAQELGKFRYKWMQEDNLNGLACDVIERVPAYKNSGYSRQLVWIDRKTLQIQRVDFFDRAGNAAKRLTYHNYKRYSGFFRPRRMAMVNLRNGKSTDLVFSQYKFGTGLSPSDFQPSALESLG